MKYVLYCVGTALSLAASLGHEFSQVEKEQNVMSNKNLYVVVLGSKRKKWFHALPPSSGDRL